MKKSFCFYGLTFFSLFCFQGFDVSDKDAFKKLHELEKTLKIERELKQRMTDRSAKAFFREFGKMVETSDVIIQVIDIYHVVKMIIYNWIITTLYT
jgi:hypothetical protein